MAGMLDRAQHEFGHNIVGRAVGFDTGDVSAEISGSTGGTAAVITNRAVTSIAEVESFCEDRIKVLYAGVLAETLKAGVLNQTAAIKLTQDTGRGDHMMVTQLCNLLRNIRYHSEPIAEAEKKMKADEIRLWNESAQMVTKYAPVIQSMAQELYERRSVHGKQAIMTKAELDAHPLIVATFP
ncbi:hypothetical protein [Devosia sp. CN2-171]|uniref:hypothetical protein n=1 Tax=Devosia sp. CN2-171 TaxID=3400909 RepID=UPI003BF91468